MSFRGVLTGAAVLAAVLSASAARGEAPCGQCAVWNAPQAPLRLFGNVYYVGTHGLSAVLITSPAGHVLIDGDLAQSVPQIVAHVRALGFRVEDIKLIVNSHVHFDHAGGIARLQRLTHARVAASPLSAPVLRSGRSGPGDPQYGLVNPIGRVRAVQTIHDGETLSVGTLSVTAHFTPGHTPGGTSWTWRSCDAGRCLDFVYADSLTAVSADDFLFTRSRTYPNALDDFEKSFAFLDGTPCDVLITPHPDQSALWDRVARRDAGAADALVDSSACRRYADGARQQLRKRIDTERAASSAASR